MMCPPNLARILAQVLCVLILLALAGTQGVSAQQSLPSCTSNIPDIDGDSVPQAMDIDKDNDGLIEICDLEGLDGMRHRLDGAGYRASADATTITTGCPSVGCLGYELTRSLDFMDASSYRTGSINTAWTSGAGWQPIGFSLLSGFSATFNGNGYTISNLMINRSSLNGVGLFGYTGGGSQIANVRLLNVDITGNQTIGGLVGGNLGTITYSYVTGSVSGSDNVGGLAGLLNDGGTITNSYATGAVFGSGNNVGGLVGGNLGTITYSYVTGSVSGSGNVGGLVGLNSNSGSITNSYAAGAVSGSGVNVGGLVGLLNDGGTISNSYWLSSSASSGGTGVPASTEKTAMELTSPTTTAMTIYAAWDPKA